MTHKRKDPKKRPVPVVMQRPPVAAVEPARGGRHKPKGGDDGPKFIGGARNEFGTRVAKRVTCTRCGGIDHVPYVPRDTQKALCRPCAQLVLDTYEKGIRIKTPMRQENCNLCGVPFELPQSVEDDGDPLCKSCLLGFCTWQGSVDTPFAERQATIIVSRGEGRTVVRKKVQPH